MDYKYNLNYTYSTTKNRLNILIVDTDNIYGTKFKDYLYKRGHNVCIVNEGISCISKCMKNNYDIIFIDYHITDINSIELIECLKEVVKITSQIYLYTNDNILINNIYVKDIIIKPQLINLSKINNFIINIENEHKL